MSLAGMTTSRLAAGLGAGFAFVFPDPCARTATGKANVITNIRIFLVLIESSVFLKSLSGSPLLSPLVRRTARLQPAARAIIPPRAAGCKSVLGLKPLDFDYIAR